MTIAPPRVYGLVVAFALGVGALGGCGGGGGKKTYADAAFSTGGTVGVGGSLGGGGTGVPGTGGATAGNGGSTVSDAGVPMPDAPPAPTNTLLVPGITGLVGPGFSCSRSPVATGAVAPDRWCGLFTVASSTATTASLVVFNLTKAIAGAPISCTATDPNCLVLSADVTLDAQHGFNGQTLIYYDAVGVYAWRPGWTAGRKLLARSSTVGALCYASSADVPNVICYQLDTAVTNATVMGFAGTIDTPTGAALASFETNLGSRPGFSPDGLSVIWSVTTNTATGGGTLKMKKIGDAGAAVTVATNVTTWGMSADLKSWLWLSAPIVDTRTQVVIGSLQTAPFPAGTPAVTVQTKTFDYAPFGTKGVTVLANPAATGTDLKSFPDVTAAPLTGTVLEAADVIYMSDVAPNGTVVFSTEGIDLDDDMETDVWTLFAVKADGTGKCTVTPDPIAFPGSVTSPGTGVAWGEVAIDTSKTVTNVTGRVTTLADCTTRTFGDAIIGFADVTTGLVYGDNFNPDASTADLAYALFAAAGTVNPKMQIQKEADLSFEGLFPELPRVLFTLNGRAMGNGVYISPPLTGVPTAMSVAPTSPTLMMPSRSQGLARTASLRRVTAPSPTLTGRMGLFSNAPSRAFKSANELRAFGHGGKPAPFLRPSVKTSRR